MFYWCKDTIFFRNYLQNSKNLRTFARDFVRIPAAPQQKVNFLHSVRTVITPALCANCI